MTETHSGSCLCGAVRFAVTGPLGGVIYCHCSQCRKQTGHIFAGTNVPKESLAVTGADHVVWYRSSPEAQRDCPLHRTYLRFTQGGFLPQPPRYFGPLRSTAL